MSFSLKILLTAFLLLNMGWVMMSTIPHVSAQVVLLEPIEGYLPGPSSTDLGSYLAGMFQLGIGIASGLAVLMIVFGGVQYMTTDSVSGKSDGLQKVESAVFGLIVALVAYLVLQTINPALVRFDIVATLEEAYATLDERFDPIDPNEGTPWGSDENNRRRFREVGFLVNKPNCTYIGQPDCTSTWSLPVDRLLALNSRCKAANGGACFSTITGGTEYWLHGAETEHGFSKPVVDMLPTGHLNKYITGSPERPTLNCYEKIVKDGATFQWEPEGCGGESTGDHWHIRY